jgi:hypothetical protein
MNAANWIGSLLSLKGRDRVVFWSFAILFSAESILITAYNFIIPSIWTLGDEGSIPTFLHSAVLAGTAAVMRLILSVRLSADHTEDVHVASRAVWFLVGLGFLYLAMDEALELHERISHWAFEFLGISSRIAHYELTPALWEAVMAPLFVAIGLMILLILYWEKNRSQAAFTLGLIAIGLWASALLVEYLEMTYFIHMKPRGSFTWFGAAIWLEETCEILASTMFLLASVLILNANIQRRRSPNKDEPAQEDSSDYPTL